MFIYYLGENEKLNARVKDNLDDYLNLVVFTNGTKATPQQVDQIRDYYFNRPGEIETSDATNVSIII